MIKLIKRLFGYSCCGEWSSWERKERRVDKLVEVNYIDKWVPWTRKYQERHCMKCGYIQQKEIKF